MTRRKFIQKLITAGSVIIAGTSWLASKAAPRKFVRAFRVKKYPGSLRPLRDVSKQSKWSG
ncbi:MAG: hypothetical protein OEW48_10050 [Phycisphaerae bacterium]|nr:hypothetical protein [Phycisphaerae bacterium]